MKQNIFKYLIILFFLFGFTVLPNLNNLKAAGQPCCNSGYRYCAAQGNCQQTSLRGGCNLSNPSHGVNCSATETCYARIQDPGGTCFAPGTTPTPFPTPVGPGNLGAELPAVFCSGGASSTPNNDPASGGILTAIGCIPYNNPTGTARFFLAWGMGIGGGIALILIVVAGYMITTSSGDPKRLQAGKELLNAALAGLVMLVAGAFILRIIGEDILKIPGFGR